MTLFPERTLCWRQAGLSVAISLLRQSLLALMCMLPQDSQILAGEQWTGSPAQYRSLSHDVGNMRKTRPSQARLVSMILAMAFSSTFVLPIIYFAPEIPSMILFEYANIAGVGWYVQTAIVCVPPTCSWCSSNSYFSHGCFGTGHRALLSHDIHLFSPQVVRRSLDGY